MNWKDLVNSNFSRKAEIVIVTIAALVYVGTLQATEGETLHVELVKGGIYGIVWIGTLGIFAQAVIDWKAPKSKVKTDDILSSQARPLNRLRCRNVAEPIVGPKGSD